MGHSFSKSYRCPGWALLLLWALLAGAVDAQAGPKVSLYLPEAPPLSMSGEVGRQGIVGDVVVKAAALAGYELQFVSLPWSRAQLTVEAGQSLLIIPLSRTPDRDKHFTWIAPILTLDRAFFSLDKRVESFEQARQVFGRIAVGRGSAQEQKLRDEGFSEQQIYPLKIGDNPAQMLLLGRVDAWFNSVPESRYIWRDVSDRPLLMSPVLMTADVYLACSKACDKTMAQRLRTAVDTLRRNGTVTRTIDGYMSATKSGKTR
jgi:polar amino acid transport system substrate-binding protein